MLNLRPRCLARAAWRYSNHLTNAFDGGVMLVTEHGWADFMTDYAGHSPAMAA